VVGPIPGAKAARLFNDRPFRAKTTNSPLRQLDIGHRDLVHSPGRAAHVSMEAMEERLPGAAMLTASFRRKTFFLLFVMLLAMPWAVSAAPMPQSERPRVAVAAEKFALDALSRIWSFIGNKIGCEVDPDGRCVPAPIPTKIGCNIDPDGLCVPAPLSTKAGCGVDPDGQCASAPAPTAQTKAGCEVDPNGRCLP